MQNYAHQQLDMAATQLCNFRAVGINVSRVNQLGTKDEMKNAIIEATISTILNHCKIASGPGKKNFNEDGVRLIRSLEPLIGYKVLGKRLGVHNRTIDKINKRDAYPDVV